MIVKRITGWEQDDDMYSSQPPLLYPTTAKVDWWDEARLTGRKEFLSFVWSVGCDEVYAEEPGSREHSWSRLRNHEACREWVRSQGWLAEGNSEQLMRLIDESEKDDQIVFKVSR